MTIVIQGNKFEYTTKDKEIQIFEPLIIFNASFRGDHSDFFANVIAEITLIGIRNVEDEIIRCRGDIFSPVPIIKFERSVENDILDVSTVTGARFMPSGNIKETIQFTCMYNDFVGNEFNNAMLMGGTLVCGIAEDNLIRMMSFYVNAINVCHS